MFLKLSFSQTSGFVAFDGGGTAEAELRREPAAAPAVVTPRLEPELLRVAAPGCRGRSRVARSADLAALDQHPVRRVEMAVIVAICAWFAAGLAGIAGWMGPLSRPATATRA